MAVDLIAEAHLSAEEGPSVRLWQGDHLLMSLEPDEARELALALWDSADTAEGLVVAKTQPSEK
jgi:hypothetical protein